MIADTILVYILFALPSSPLWKDNYEISRSSTLQSCEVAKQLEEKKRVGTTLICQPAVLPVKKVV